MKKPVPRKLKLPPAPITEPLPPVPPPPTRAVPPRPKLPSAAVPATPFVFTPIAPPNRVDPYRPPAPPPYETLAAPVPPPPPPPPREPPQAVERPAPRLPPQASSGARSVARDLMIAAIGALVMFFCAIIPAALGIDAFGIGQMLGIAGREQAVQAPPPQPVQQARPEVSKRDFDMLAIRLSQANERISSLEHSVEVLAARSAQNETQPTAGSGAEVIAPLAGGETNAQTAPTTEVAAQPDGNGMKADKWTHTLKPGEGVQLKLTMEKGAAVRYAWTVRGGLVNYDMQGSGEGTTTTYKSRRDASSDNGVLTAAVTGDHGWFWRNGGAQDVVITLAARGEYGSLKSTP